VIRWIKRRRRKGGNERFFLFVLFWEIMVIWMGRVGGIFDRIVLVIILCYHESELGNDYIIKNN
jgi:hypothetical protein